MSASRKRSLPVLLAAVAAALGCASAGEPTDQIRQTTDKILAVVQDPALHGPAREAERQKRMRQAIDERFDWAAMARSAIGRHWRSLNDAERAEFTGLFSDLIERSYMSKVESYSGEKIQYKGDTVDGIYGAVEVAIVTLRGTDIPISYRVRGKGAAWLVYDVVIEGVSLVNNYRSQIAAILNSTSYDGLIRKIKAKIADSVPGKGAEQAGSPAEQKPRENVP